MHEQSLQRAIACGAIRDARKRLTVWKPASHLSLSAIEDFLVTLHGHESRRASVPNHWARLTHLRWRPDSLAYAPPIVHLPDEATPDVLLAQIPQIMGGFDVFQARWPDYQSLPFYFGSESWEVLALRQITEHPEATDDVWLRVLRELGRVRRTNAIIDWARARDAPTVQLALVQLPAPQCFPATVLSIATRPASDAVFLACVRRLIPRAIISVARLLNDPAIPPSRLACLGPDEISALLTSEYPEAVTAGLRVMAQMPTPAE